jgi:hypothetical protein
MRLCRQTEIPAAELVRSNQTASRAAEGVQYNITHSAKGLYQWHKTAHRLLSRMKPVLRILPAQNVAQSDDGLRRRPLSQEIRLLVVIAYEALPRCISLRPDKVRNRVKSRAAPGRKEAVNFRPGITGWEDRQRE